MVKPQVLTKEEPAGISVLSGMVTSVMLGLTLSQDVEEDEAGLGVFKTSGVTEGVPAEGVSVIRGVLVGVGENAGSGVLVAVGVGVAAIAV